MPLTNVLVHLRGRPGTNVVLFVAHYDSVPAGPGAGAGLIVTTAEKAETWAKAGKSVVLVRAETSPEDVHGMHVAQAIVTAKGGMTSHAALVARGWGKCCVVGCSALDVDSRKGVVRVGGKTLPEGQPITINGTRGRLYLGTLPLLPADPDSNPWYRKLMQWADGVRRLKVRTNADRPEDAAQARAFGAQGIGLTRTEHMFFDAKRIRAMREMIVAETEKDRRRAVMKLLPYQRKDFEGILKAMAGLPVTIRFLDPPLHEFITLDVKQTAELARSLKIQPRKLAARISQLHELNPMLGHRGCRLGITYPEISEMQARAVFEATAALRKKKIEAIPEIMIPLVGTAAELADQEKIVRSVAEAVKKETGVNFPYTVGTMIEIPRAALTADKIAEVAEFFSFGTNDLTQTTYGFSRDDIGSFLPQYIAKKILAADPFQTLDREGVGSLMKMAVEKGRTARPGLKMGICGEHGGDPASVKFCHAIGLDYVSCPGGPRGPDLLRILLLSRRRTLYSTRRLVETARRMGHRAIVVDPLNCFLVCGNRSPSIYHKSGHKRLDHVDLVLPRIGASITEYGLAVVRQFSCRSRARGTSCARCSCSLCTGSTSPEPSWRARLPRSSARFRRSAAPPLSSS